MQFYLLGDYLLGLLLNVFVQVVYLLPGLFFSVLVLLQHVPVLDVLLHSALSHLFDLLTLLSHSCSVLFYLLFQHLYQLHLSFYLLFIVSVLTCGGWAYPLVGV